jgi:hypothetical protein
MKNEWIRWLFFRLYCPLVFAIGWLLRMDMERLRNRLIMMNNSLVRNSARSPADSVLLLLPHCLQYSECNIRITRNVFNCESCGRCSIKEFTGLARELKMNLFVATGGTLARRIVDENRSDAIVAVACERDLISGIMDTYPIPVLGIINERPFGPCLNTEVDFNSVKEALTFFSGRERESHC